MEKVIVVGGSGFIEPHLIQYLIQKDRIEQIVGLVRKPLTFIHAKLKQHIVSFDEPGTYKEYIYGNVNFGSLGTTKSKTPDLKEYKKFDYEYPLLIAHRASEHLVPQYHLNSSLSTNNQFVMFYTETKCELEEHIKRIKFTSLRIYQPSLLNSDYKESQNNGKNCNSCNEIH